MPKTITLDTNQAKKATEAFLLLARLHQAAMERLADGELRAPGGDTGAGEPDPQQELEALARLEPEAITRIHGRYFPVVYKFARYRLSDEVLAEDVAAETFARLIEYASIGRGPNTNVRGWLMRTASNLVNDYYRAMYSRPTAELPETLPSTSPGPVGTFETTEEHRQLHEALKNLTDDQANVLALRFGSGLSLAETADALGKNANAIKALQFRAIGALRRELTQA
ncbi:MAG TPA: sigma-70 family RNA polymerase sigma factor [Anaerolineales bacterium]|nr:sigma-70 family RNA polymerase sigma factor [Anaerolineales bacterium]